MSNLSNGDEIQLLKFKDGNFYYINGAGQYVLFQTGSGEPTWSQTLTSGNTSGGVSPIISSGDTLKFAKGETSSLTAATQTAARTWTLPDKTGTLAVSPTLTEVLGNGNTTSGTNIVVSANDVITTGASISGMTINLDYGGSGKDALISTDAGSELEAGIYISNANGSYGLSNFVDGYVAVTTIEKTSNYAGNRGFAYTVNLANGLTEGNFLGIYDRASDVSNATFGSLISKFGFASIGDTDSTVTFSSANDTGAGFVHANQVTINSGVENSFGVSGGNYVLKTNNTAYATQFALGTASYETLIKTATQTADRTVTFGDRNLDFTTAQTYTPTNVTTDRSYDANATTLDELADVVGTLIADLQAIGILS